jgi:secretion/DNA translocation related TadE-like protein
VSRRDRGAVTVLAVALLGVLFLLTAGLGMAEAMVVAHRRAQTAADLGALAGAHALQRGQDGCVASSVVVRANDATLDACRLEGADVLVEVTVRGPSWLGQRGSLQAQARAGPVS